MSLRSGKLAQRYAKALLKAVMSERNSVPAEQLAADLERFAEIWRDVPQFSASLVNPMFQKEDRLKALLRVAAEAALPDLAKQFLRVVFERDRVAALPDIIASFSEQVALAQGRVAVEVTTARSIDDGERRDIEASLAQHIRGNLNFNWTVDPELIGGMIVRHQGRIIDGSLRGRLERIERKLMG